MARRRAYGLRIGGWELVLRRGYSRELEERHYEAREKILDYLAGVREDFLERERVRQQQGALPYG